MCIVIGGVGGVVITGCRGFGVVFGGKLVVWVRLTGDVDTGVLILQHPFMANTLSMNLFGPFVVFGLGDVALASIWALVLT